MVVAPALIPKRPGEHVKTNRRDAITLARLHRAGELTAVWVPDAVHEAVRDLVRARQAAADDLRCKRQQLLSFLLRRGRIYSGGRWRIGTGSPGRLSTIRLNKLSSRKALTRSKMRFSDVWNNSWPLSYRAGQWHRRLRPIRQYAGPRSWSL